MANGIPDHLLPVRGIESAPEYFIEDLVDIQFCGVTTVLVPYRTVITPAGSFRAVPFVARVPTGALAAIERRLFKFAKEHQLLARVDHEDAP